jgi:hypothetical protein
MRLAKPNATMVDMADDARDRCGGHPGAAEPDAGVLNARSAGSWDMPETACQQKIPFGEMRDSGVRGILIYCADYKCSHSIAISAHRWSDGVRLSDIEPRFTCQACGHRGADIRPDFGWIEAARRATLDDTRRA